ncbi:hypothetical protein [Caldalkalibacillus mannanilyticus]|uniref:hypothetical protein n=1 Tax=Caldalkalibacillus mannanilyticus TaxID=1418 RepID=UPI00046A8022|nr:hypothetical protein [Caldalkalibacillus mannanilyticus]
MRIFLIPILGLLMFLSGCFSTPSEDARFQPYEENRSIEHPNQHQTMVENAPILLFEEFMQKWNAISAEHTGDFFIHSFEQIHSETDQVYRTSLGKHLELQVTVANSHVIKAQLIGSPPSTKERFTMITSWWQLFLMTNSTIAVHDIDLLFAELGIGPNADLSELTSRTFDYNGITYSIHEENNRYLFEAAYP